MLHPTGGLFDGYHRVARVSPAVLTFLPVTWTSYLMLGGQQISAIGGGIGLAATVALSYFAASFARSRGRAIEPQLISQLGARPTTILLRNRDPQIDATTKQRYHLALAESTRCLLPTADEEASNPEKADELYASAVTALSEARRGDDHKLILEELKSYGFRRNLLGLKPIALFVSLGLAIGIGGWWYFLGFADWHRPLLSIAFDIVYAIGFASVVTMSFVQEASFDYARALLRSLDRRTDTA